MAEVNNGDEPLLPTKRTSDLISQDEPNYPKKHKLEDNNGGKAPEPPKPSAEDEAVQTPKDKPELVGEEEKPEEEQKQQRREETEKDNANGEVVIDRKGKGILIEEDEEDEDDDSDDSDSDSDSDIGDYSSDESDFADDPLAEVDLDNILPSRTRRKSIQPGAYIANDLTDEGSDESDDPDA